MVELLIGILIALSTAEAPQAPAAAVTDTCVWSDAARFVYSDLNRGYYDSGLYDWHKSYDSGDIADPILNAEYVDIITAYNGYAESFIVEWEALGSNSDVEAIWLNGLDGGESLSKGLELMRQGAIDLDATTFGNGIDYHNAGIELLSSVNSELDDLWDECHGDSVDAGSET